MIVRANGKKENKGEFRPNRSDQQPNPIWAYTDGAHDPLASVLD